MLEEALTFDDVLLEPSYSEIVTRSHIDLTQNNFLGLRLLYPIISANMNYVTGYEMAKEMWNVGGLGILHRFESWELQVNTVYALEAENKPTIISVGTRDIEESLAHVKQIVTNLDAVCIDIAHGHHKQVAALIDKIKTLSPRMQVIAGNVATRAGFQFLQNAGADAIKVGIGPGSVCTTRTVTGVGVPQLTAIMRAAEVQQNALIIADGGIKNSGDIVKALAAGADAVMIGSLLAGTNECPGETRIGPDDTTWRPYVGQSIFGTNGYKYVPEGIEGWVKSKGPVENVIKQLVGGIRSGMSYVGAYNLEQLRAKANFIRVSPLSQLETGTRVSMDI